MIKQHSKDSHASVADSDRGLSAARREISLKRLLIAAFIVGLVLLTLAFGLYVYSFGTGLANKKEEWGQFGDYLGGVVNPLFGFLTLLSVVYTLHLQRELLQDSKAQAISAMKDSAANLRHVAKQLEQMQIQAFDNTYFLLIRLREDFAARICLSRNATDHWDAEIVGRDCFKSIIEEYAQVCFSAYLRGDFNGLPRSSFLRKSTAEFFSSVHDSIHLYFGPTFELLALIDAFQDQDPAEKLEESYLPDFSSTVWTPTHSTNAKKQRYVNLIVANLTYYESLLIALYALRTVESIRDCAMIERYGLLRHLKDNPSHPVKDEMGPEQQMIYSLRETYKSIAFEPPEALRTKY